MRTEEYKKELRTKYIKLIKPNSEQITAWNYGFDSGCWAGKRRSKEYWLASKKTYERVKFLNRTVAQAEDGAKGDFKFEKKQKGEDKK